MKFRMSAGTVFFAIVLGAPAVAQDAVSGARSTIDDARAQEQAPAAPTTPATVGAAEALAEKIGEGLRRMDPNRKIDYVGPSPVPGYVEIVSAGESFFVTDDGRYLVQTLYDMIDGRDISQFGALPKLTLLALEKIPKSERILFPATGQTRHTIVVFTDVDCGFCMKLHQDIENYNRLGIAVEYVAFPRSGTNGEVYEKMRAVWCSPDRNKALTDAKNGAKVAARRCDDPVSRHYQVGVDIGVRGTPVVITGKGVKYSGYVPPEMLLRFLDAEKDQYGKVDVSAQR
ncbi:MAG: thioredoxin fold domain-containing protein [Pseudomonadota bacterium]